MTNQPIKHLSASIATLSGMLFLASCGSSSSSDGMLALLGLNAGDTSTGISSKNQAALDAMASTGSLSSLSKTSGALSVSAKALTPYGDAIIDNGTVQLGVNPEGHLNVPGGTLSTGRSGTTSVGLRYVPDNSEATAPGCLCEGWGVADASTGIYGNASVHTGGVDNLSVESFTVTADSAVSVVKVGSTFRVTHDYHPSAETPYLYEAVVTIENISGSDVGSLRYTRGMDWDISPNTFSEYTTIQGTAAAENVLYANDNGFQDVNPLASRSKLQAEGDFVDSGPYDHGAHFDFDFGVLAAGQSRTFKIFYGAAGNEATAISAIGAVAAEVYSFGQANWNGTGDPKSPSGAPTGTYGATTGEPHTFIFAFSGVGGVPIVNAPPVADAGEDVTVTECDRAGAHVTLDGSLSSDPEEGPLAFLWESPGVTFDDATSVTPTGLFTPGTPEDLFAPGVHEVTLTVTDDGDLTDSDTVTVTVIRPPYDFETTGPTALWPPNHKYVTIGFTTPVCGVDASYVSVDATIVSDEMDEATGEGDGHHTGDIKVTRADGSVVYSSNESPVVHFNPFKDKLELRSERMGAEDGRVYTIVVNIMEDGVVVHTQSFEVSVPHDMGE